MNKPHTLSYHGALKVRLPQDRVIRNEDNCREYIIQLLAMAIK